MILNVAFNFLPIFEKRINRGDRKKVLTIERSTDGASAKDLLWKESDFSFIRAPLGFY